MEVAENFPPGFLCFADEKRQAVEASYNIGLVLVLLQILLQILDSREKWVEEVVCGLLTAGRSGGDWPGRLILTLLSTLETHQPRPLLLRIALFSTTRDLL